MTNAATGVRCDCDKFVSQFKALNTLRFEQFAQLWREMQFSFVFYGRELEADLVDFTEEALRVAKNLWLSQSDIQERVCGFYLLYAFYVKQPTKVKVKIRMTMAEWNGCAEFVRVVQHDSHWDIVFVFRMLATSCAFHFVLLPLENLPSVSSDEQKSEGPWRASVVADVLDKYVSGGHVEKLASVHRKYEAMKSEVSRSHFEPAEVSSLRLAAADVIETLSKLAAAEGAPEAVGEAIGSRRAQLKQRTFSQRGRRHLQDE